MIDMSWDKKLNTEQRELIEIVETLETIVKQATLPAVGVDTTHLLVKLKNGEQIKVSAEYLIELEEKI